MNTAIVTPYSHLLPVSEDKNHLMLSKIALSAILLLLLTGCCYPINSPWILETTQTYCSAYRSARITLCGNHLNVEMIRDPYDLRLYFSLMVCPVEPDASDQSFPFTYLINDVKYHGRAYVLEGGQRLLVDDLAGKGIIEALYEGLTVQLSFGMYAESVESANFPELYDWLIRWKI